MDENNVNRTGWIEDNNNWYYLENSGAMKTGWLNYQNSWYFLEKSGVMQTGWVLTDGKWYYFDATGVMKNRWIKHNKNWYYLNQDGEMQTGVISVADKVYYLNKDGAMQVGKIEIDGVEYEFATNGEAVGAKPNVENHKKFELIEKDKDKDKEDKEDKEHKEDKEDSKEHSSKGKWKLAWTENFDGDSLNLDNWNYETHEPGWVNQELQEYTDSTDNIFVEDGKLVLKAIKTIGEDGQPYYTSGKVTTQNKKCFKYGKFELRAKTPRGKGLWPALWMMPNDESLYGQWPKCGEIDIMEVLGHEPKKTYATIHYGSPHEEKQGTYTLENGSFADDYHVYSLEWEPDEMRFYVDGHLVNKVNDWFTKVEGGDEVAYPAPFDQPFYLQCNLAVGGTWPGNPDETTDFDNAEFKIDYIKVYELKNYNENVQKPEKPPVVLRDPDATGNYVVNGNFADDSEDNNWDFLQALGGVGSSSIAGNKISINTENAGTVDYSIQLVQPGIPLQKLGRYKVSFDAKAEENRNMIVGISGPDRSWIRYFNDTTVALTTESQHYEYEFDMENDDDANARLEFNMGNQHSTAGIEISNVRIEKIGQGEEEENPNKKIMPDGNYVNNGGFDVGSDRMEYWEVENTKKSTLKVTNKNNVRELKVDVKKASRLEDVILRQTRLSLAPNTHYTLSFDAYADKNKTIAAQINEERFEADITTEKTKYSYDFITGDTVNNADLELLLGVAGITYIDNVRIEESALLKNGSFNSGVSNWELFSDGGISTKPTYAVDSLSEDNACQVNISESGDADWKIQLKQEGIKMEQGKTYRIAFKIKSTLDRKVKYAIQGGESRGWAQYAVPEELDLTNQYQTVEQEFTMNDETDTNSIFTISMGAIDSEINTRHTVTVDDVTLEEVH